jgi:hypothetical protein
MLLLVILRASLCAADVNANALFYTRTRQQDEAGRVGQEKYLADAIVAGVQFRLNKSN